MKIGAWNSTLFNHRGWLANADLRHLGQKVPATLGDRLKKKGGVSNEEEKK